MAIHESFVRGQSSGVQANEYDTLSINGARGCGHAGREHSGSKGFRRQKNVRGLITLFTGMPLFVKEGREGTGGGKKHEKFQCADSGSGDDDD